MKKTIEPLYVISSLFGGVVLLFIVAPLISIFINTSPGELLKTVRDPEVTGSIWLTLLTSIGATLACAIASIPFSYILAKKKFPLKGIINGIIDLPIVIPHSAAGIALLGIFSQKSFFGGMCEKLGLEFIGSSAGIMVAMAFVSIPFLINSARDGFSAVPEELEKAAMNLGAGPFRVFMTIALPIAWRSILSGLVLMWARGMSEFGAVVIIAYHPMVTPVLMYERLGAFGLKYARPISAIFLIICFVSFVFLRMIGARKHYVES